DRTQADRGPARVMSAEVAARRYREEGWWRDGRLTDDVRRWAEQSSDRTAVVDGEHRASYGELWREARRVAASLAELGIGRGDVVSSQLPNGLQCIVVHLAVELAGGIHNPL